MAGVFQAMVDSRHDAGDHRHRVDAVRARPRGDGAAVAGGRPARPHRQLADRTRRAAGAPPRRPGHRARCRSPSSPRQPRSRSLGTSRAIAPAAILALPTMLAGAAGGVVSIVRDAPDPDQAARPSVRPAGDGRHDPARCASACRSWSARSPRPPCCSFAAPSSCGTSPTGAALRGAIGALLLIVLVSYWVRKRDHWRRKFRQFMSEGQAYTKQQRSTPA